MKKSYSIILVPDADQRPVSLKISRWLILGVLFVCCSLVAALGLVAYGYWSQSNQVWALEDVKKQNQEYRRTLASLTAQMDGVQGQLDEISNVRSKVLRLLALPDKIADQNARGGVGVVDGHAEFVDIYRGKEHELLEEMSENFEDMQQHADTELEVHRKLSDFLSSRTLLLKALPSIRPASGGWVSSSFSPRRDPWTGNVRMHKGIDIAHSRPVPVFVTADGVVTVSHWEGGYGKIVEVEHGFGFTTRYGHLSSIDVSVGDELARGEQIGRVGNTGRSTGRHLHYEVLLDGVPLDPMTFILDGDSSS